MAEIFGADMTEEQMFTLAVHREMHRAWSNKCFGDIGPVGPLWHLILEAEEAADSPDDVMEYVDCQFLLWDALARQDSFTVEEFITAMGKKLLTLKLRTYAKMPDGVPSQHIEDGCEGEM